MAVALSRSLNERLSVVYSETDLRLCEAEISKRPNLASIFDEQFRENIRMSVLTGKSQGPPYIYAFPIQHDRYPEQYPLYLLDRIENGLELLLKITPNKERNELERRMKDGNGLSVEEELITLSGFRDAFGDESISLSVNPRGTKKAEFVVSAHDCRFAVECKGLLDPQRIQSLNEGAIEQGIFHWFGYFRPGSDEHRFGQAVREKIEKNQGDLPTIFMITQYTPWVDPGAAKQIIDQILLENDENTDHGRSIAICYIIDRLFQGHWVSKKFRDSHLPVNDSIDLALKVTFVRQPE